MAKEYYWDYWEKIMGCMSGFIVSSTEFDYDMFYYYSLHQCEILVFLIDYLLMIHIV